jgi:metal-responsive CopG/Arc/MetJ family transcriptional regulator
MKPKKAHRKNMESQGDAPIRASISFPPDVYKNLEQIATRKKVSIAWVVRDAAEKYIAEQSKA